MGDAMVVFVFLLNEQVVLHASQPILKIADSLVYNLFQSAASYGSFIIGVVDMNAAIRHQHSLHSSWCHKRHDNVGL
jgi:hypothetical protein